MHDLLSGGWPSSRAAAAPEMLRIRPDHLELADGRVACSLAVQGYPREVTSGWLGVLHELEGDYRYAQHVEPLDSLAALAELTRHLRQLRTSLLMAGTRGAEHDALDQTAADDAEALRLAVALGNVRLFRHHLLLTLFARDPKELRQRSAAATSILERHLLTARRCLLQEAEAFIATMPLGRLPASSGRNMDSDAVAAALPVGGAAPRTGEAWGLEVRHRTLVCVDRFAAPNPHALGLAGSGAGKSFWLKHLLTQAVLSGQRACVLDPQGEYGAWCQGLGGRHIRLRPGGAFAFNVLAKPALMPIETWRAIRMERIQELMQLVGEAPGVAAIDSALRAAEAADPGEPTLKAVAQALAGAGGRLAAAVRGPLAPFSGAQPLGMDDQALVFDLQDVMGEPAPMVAAALLLLTRQVIDHCVSPDLPPVTIAIDEAHHLLREPAGARFIEVLFRSGRKRGAAVCLVTQSIGDLLAGQAHPDASRAARAALANAATVFLMRQENAHEVQCLTDLYRLDATESRWLQGCRPGEGLLISGGRRALVRIEVPKALHSAFSTTPTGGTPPHSAGEVAPDSAGRPPPWSSPRGGDRRDLGAAGAGTVADGQASG